MRFVDSGNDYEKYVRDIQQTLLEAQNLETVQAVHDIELMGNTGQAHQIDVYWEYRLAGVTHRVALECKLRGRKVDLGIARDFWGVIDDIPGLRGVIVSPVGFTGGAIQYARNKGIGLKVIRPAIKADFEGRLQTIYLKMDLRQAEILQLKINFDDTWYENNKTPQLEQFVSKVGSGAQIRTDGIVLEDRESGESILLERLPNYIPALQVEDTSIVHSWSKPFGDGYFIRPDGLEVRLISIEVKYRVHKYEQSITVGGDEVAYILIQDALTGTLLFVDEQHSISGDVSKEGIQNNK